jgi:hypothetical protein
MLGGGGAKPGPDGGPIFGHGQTSYSKAALKARMARATPQVQRQVLVTACEFAATQSGLDHPLAQEALAAVREGRRLPSGQREQLNVLAEELDSRYTELQEAAEAGQATDEDWQAVFRKCIALRSLWGATSDDPVRDAGDVVYEAWFAADQPNDLPQRIEELLG